MTDNAKCPDCGNTEIGKGKLSGYAVLCMCQVKK